MGRVPKTIIPGKESSVLIPEQYSPVPAVPTRDVGLNSVPAVPKRDVGLNSVPAVPTRDVGLRNSVPAVPTRDVGLRNSGPAVPTRDVGLRNSVQVDDVKKPVEIVKVAALTQVTPVYEDNFLTAQEERKQFKRCHGKCVQKFCLPVGNL